MHSQETKKYSRITRWLHAFFVVSMIYMLIIGFFVDYFKKLDMVFLSIHKGLGVILVFVTLFMFFWMLYEKKPGLPFRQPLWEQFLARVVQRMLLVAVFLQALSGWFMSTAIGHPPKLFFWTVPAPIEPSQNTFVFFHNIHGIVDWIILVLLGLHVLGTLKHLMFDKVNLLKRIF